ncbi:intercellular adhesion molecule 3 isoform X2 [Neofelis nebulosa]|uniref:intercellular adhesion molecule 3 isoform X2 n=1 Tax=Neofelis nebulosa TaxID=61452 RepID=UPI002729D895|nr:intercellular adhesion molecule 3 isoform X2 [Neofelis nebulosa]
MSPSGLLRGACRTTLISLLLVCCLLPPGAQGQKFPLRVEPQNPVLPAGGSFLVNCSTDCPNPKLITLETSLPKKPVGNGLGWAAFQLSSVTSDSQVLCSGFCDGFQMTASSDITVYPLPVTPPHLVVPRLLEVGTTWSVNCTLDRLFPASEAQVQLALGNQMLTPAVESHGDTITATATVTASAEQEGAREIVCNLTLGSDSREARENLTIYSFWGPILNLSESSASEGTEVTVTCAAGARVQVTLEGVPAAAPGQPAQLQLIATERDDRRNFSCNATLEVDREILHRNRSVQLRVLYGPKIDQAKCPQRLTWKDRTTNVLRCQAQGNPDPELHCFQEGSWNEVPVGIPFTVMLNYSGTYSCRAVSSRGTYTVTVVMNVQGRNAHAVTIVMVVLVTLGLVTTTAALVYVFGLQKRSDIYQVNQGSTWLPLTSRQPEEAVGEGPS